MKNIFTFLLVLFVVNLGVSQQLLFEDFNATGGVLPAGWQSIDNDAPIPNSNLGPEWDMWHVEASILGTDSVIAASSWLDVTTVPADDWLITPVVSGLQATASLNWKAGSALASYLEPYEVYVSTGSTIADFLATTPIYTTAGEPAALTQKTASLAAYAGQSIYIAFRITGQDSYIIEIDDIEVTNAAPPPPPPPPVNDDCANSIDVNSSLGLGVGVPGSSGPYDNSGAAAHPTDPTTGFACFFDLDVAGTQAPLIDNSMWYTFVGDGKTYEITSTDCGGGGAPTSNLIISGIGDGPLSGGQPKFVELYAAGPIADLGIYAMESVNNGAGIGLPEYTFPAGVSVAQGTYIYVTGDAAAFTAFFGFNADYIDSPSTSINGDDAVALYENGTVIDVAGDPNMDGSGTPWEYLDGFMYRIAGKSASATFNVADWTYSGINVFDGQTTNATSPTPFPNGTFTGGAFSYITNGDTQFALYEGACGTLTPVDCNEDGPNATAGNYAAAFTVTTTPGTTYYLMVDGWSDLSSGGTSEGQYCVQFTEEVLPPCNAGVIVNTGPFTVCAGDTANVAVTLDSIPTGGGYGWIFSDSQGGTGGLAGGLFLFGAQTSYTFDADLNGVLSANSLPELVGTWVVYGATYTDPANAGGTICSITTDSVLVHFSPSIGYIIDFGQTSLVVDCNGDQTGAIVITTTGGIPPYTYLWSNGATTEDLTGLGVGSYSGTITDANGCELVSPPIPITEPDAVGYIIDFGQTSLAVACNGDQTGAIVITTTGGTPPYTFIWSNGATTEDLTGLGVGAYSGTITDANGCVLTSPPIPISEPAALTGSATTTPETSAGAGGAVDFTPGGGTPPFTFLWSNGATSEDLTNVAGGSYTVDVTDDNGCTMTFGPYLVDMFLATTAIDGLNDLNIQPNPTQGQVTINLELEYQMEVKLELYAVSGRLLQSFERESLSSKSYDLDLSNYPAGIYFAKFQINDQIVTKRISLMK